jgi:hypothetical protein
MAVHQRGVTLTDAQVKSIEIWMDSLTGQVPVSYIKPPELPKSTSQTPRPSGEQQYWDRDLVLWNRVTLLDPRFLCRSSNSAAKNR